jgi:hypothetical protein
MAITGSDNRRASSANRRRNASTALSSICWTIVRSVSIWSEVATGYALGLSQWPTRASVLAEPGPLIVAAAAWLGLSFVGTGQPVHAQSPTNGRAAAGRVEGGSDVLSLGTAASESPICWCTLAPAFRQARIWSESSAVPSSARARLANRIWRWPKRFMWGRWTGLREAISVGGQTSILPRQGF